MPTDVRQFQVTVATGKTPAAPQITNLTMPARTVRSVEVRVPPGPRGEVGWALGAAGQAVFPFEAGTWVVTDDERIEWQLQTPLDSGAWQLFAYNTGTYPHTLYITFLCDVPGQGASTQSFQPIDTVALQGDGVPVDVTPVTPAPTDPTQQPPDATQTPPAAPTPSPPPQNTNTGTNVPQGPLYGPVTAWGLPTSPPYAPTFSP